MYTIAIIGTTMAVTRARPPLLSVLPRGVAQAIVRTRPAPRGALLQMYGRGCARRRSKPATGIATADFGTVNRSCSGRPPALIIPSTS